MIDPHIDDHYRSLFGIACEHPINLEPGIWGDTTDLRRSEDNITKAGVQKAIWGFGSDKAPGLDGFPIFFFKHF